MGRSTSAAISREEYDDEFDIPSQIAILRRAVAEIEIGRESQRARGGALRDLMRISALAESTVSAIAMLEVTDEDPELAQACAVALFGVQDAQRLLDQVSAPRPSRARLEAIRRKLHAALAGLGEVLAIHDGVDRPSNDLERALHVRTLLSDFYGAIPWEKGGPSSRVWALLVADAELRILLKSVSFSEALEAPRTSLVTLGERLAGWLAKRPGPSATSQLYTELVGVSNVLSMLSARPEVKRHDARALVELSALLARRTFDDTMTERVVDVLATVRGMDGELDRLIVALPLDPPGVLALLLRRVTQLRARSLAS
jgi:hypothetical protein